MSERRYTEAEAAEIFRRAAESEHGAARGVAASEGLTLAQLTDIGREAGLDPALVRRAALATAVPGGVTVRLAGLPLAVGRTIELDRPLSDAEWEDLVSDLRSTFRARGQLRHDGSFRQWTNGNLHVLVEPTSSGHRIRFGTLNGAARGWLTAGSVLLAMSAVLGVIGMVGGDPDAVSRIVGLAAAGSVMLGAGAIRLPGWARTRLGQMDGLIARLRASTEPGRLPPPADDRPAG